MCHVVPCLPVLLVQMLPACLACSNAPCQSCLFKCSRLFKSCLPVLLVRILPALLVQTLPALLVQILPALLVQIIPACVDCSNPACLACSNSACLACSNPALATCNVQFIPCGIILSFSQVKASEPIMIEIWSSISPLIPKGHKS